MLVNVQKFNYINNLLPSGQTVTNIDTKDNIDVFMNNFIKIK